MIYVSVEQDYIGGTAGSNMVLLLASGNKNVHILVGMFFSGN